MNYGTAARRGWWLSSVVLFVLTCLVGGSALARADDAAPMTRGRTGGVFKICHNQTYALCAVSSCLVFNGVAYCTCDVKRGDSISLPFRYGRGNDVCSVNAEG